MFSARRLLLGASGVSDITSPSNPALQFLYTGDNVTPPTVFDESPNARNATINGSVTSVSGHIGNALDFLGASTDYLSLPYDFQTEINSGDFGISTWVNFDSLSAFNGVFGSSPAASAEIGFALFVVSSGDVRFDIVRGAAGSPTVSVTSSGAGITAGSYFHIIINGSSATGVELFVNNVSAVSSGYTNPLPTGSATRALNIGRINHTSSHSPMNGKIDKTYFHNQPYSATERGILYNSGVGA